MIEVRNVTLGICLVKHCGLKPCLTSGREFGQGFSSVLFLSKIFFAAPLVNLSYRVDNKIKRIITMNKSINKIGSQIRWRLMSDRERYALLWARSRAHWDTI